jgi:alanine racemase
MRLVSAHQRYKHNHQLLQQIYGNLPIAPVLKSNAYGHGLTLAARIFDKLRPPFLVVDSLYEAYELKKLRLKTPILIMGYTHHCNLLRKQLPFHWAVFDLETAKALNRSQRQCQIHLFVDTGMHREGVPFSLLDDFLSELRQMPNLQIAGLCSHFADADGMGPKADEHTKQQIKTFRQAVQTLQKHGHDPVWRHITASAGTLKKLAHRDCTMARVGLASYGISPLVDHKKTESGMAKKLQPALQFTSTIALIKHLEKGAWIGYGASFTAKRQMKIALLPIGYYEGIDRRLSNTGSVYVRGVRCQVIGRVSMNMTSIDVTEVKEVEVGDQVEVFGTDLARENTITASANVAQTIAYELLVHLASSVRRKLVP